MQKINMVTLKAKVHLTYIIEVNKMHNQNTNEIAW